MEPVFGGLVLLRRQTPLTRRLLVYFASGAYILDHLSLRSQLFQHFNDVHKCRRTVSPPGNMPHKLVVTHLRLGEELPGGYLHHKRRNGGQSHCQV